MHPVEKRWCVLAEGRQSSPVPEHTRGEVEQGLAEREGLAGRDGHCTSHRVWTSPDGHREDFSRAAAVVRPGQRREQEGCGRQDHP